MNSLQMSLAVAIAFCSVLQAQIASFGEADAAVGHVHIVTRDVPAHRTFWTALGATPGKLGALDVMQFPGIMILIEQGESSGGSAGSVVDHFAFLVKDSKAALSRWHAAGLSVVTPFNANNLGAFLLAPDNIRVEVNEDPIILRPIVHHHIHWFVPDTKAAQSWYARIFGAAPGKRNEMDAADMPGGNLTFTQARAVTVPTKGRALDHLGFEIRNLEQLCRRLEADGQKFDQPLTMRPELGLKLALIFDPWGTYIELTEGLRRP